MFVEYAVTPLNLLVTPRAMLIVAGGLYACAMHFAHAYYLNPVWDYFGFTYKTPGVPEILFIAFLVTLASWLMPSVLARPSSIIVLLLFLVVYVPTVVITLGLPGDNISRYGTSLLMLGLAFSVVSLSARIRNRSIARVDVFPDVSLVVVFVIVWVAAAAALLYRYGSIMAFAGWNDIYEQRAAGASDSVWMGYLQTYFGSVVSPALIALGLVRTRLSLILTGALGCLLIYMINAQRTVILLPFAMIALYILLRSRHRFLRISAFPVIVVACSVVLAVAFYAESSIASLFSTYLVFRTLGIPGLTFSQYFDLFGPDGFTWWGHVKGISLLISPPPQFGGDPSWPSLGYIVGDRVYEDIEHNVNANLFSGDGVAAAGALGVGVVGAALAVWLSAMDRISHSWNRHFAVLVMLPVGLALTNGHFFTVMLSFGGLFWLSLFALYRKFCYRSSAERRSITSMES